MIRLAAIGLALVAPASRGSAQDEPDTTVPSAQEAAAHRVADPAAPAAKPARAATRVGVSSGGSTRVDAHARNVMTVADDGVAVTNIGVGRPGASTSVYAEDIVTVGRGQSAETDIGTGSGFVSATDIYNGGGRLSIGAEGTKRDGKTCVEIYRNTCIVHFYYRRKNDPCAPGYWIDGRKCRLPSDRKHRIGS
ncbi:MAG TPA: hypothetical protein VF547_00885 [Allosphingosinicella sp.]|jgi:hypothetical protein